MKFNSQEKGLHIDNFMPLLEDTNKPNRCIQLRITLLGNEIEKLHNNRSNNKCSARNKSVYIIIGDLIFNL